jgi:hypothetical protein
MVFEKKMLRKTFSPTKERDGTWRIKTNDKLDKLITHNNEVNHIKAQRLKLIWPFTANVGRENCKEKSI